MAEKRENKRGLSPVVATTLLILIGLALAAIIFFWAKSFVSEKLQKNVGGGASAEAIELLCDEVRFDADAYVAGQDLDLSLVNKGNIPLYGAEARKKTFGGLKIVGTGTSDLGIKSGEDYTLKITPQINVQHGDNITIIPVLLGTVGDSDTRKTYTCDFQYGIEAQVQ